MGKKVHWRESRTGKETLARSLPARFAGHNRAIYTRKNKTRLT